MARTPKAGATYESDLLGSCMDVTSVIDRLTRPAGGRVRVVKVVILPYCRARIKRRLAL